ncbi:MAG TPA: extensin family protein [Novosphingobium sp.]|nr:extensin family protein [Novosphingobium sp.]
MPRTSFATLGRATGCGVALVAALALSACQAVPEHRSHTGATALRPSVDAGKCLADLGARMANFTPLPDQYFGAGCSNINTVRLSSVTSDSAWLSLTNLGPVACPLANTFAGWARFGVDRAARQYLGSPLARIETMGSYACRNVAGTDRRSAHSTGNAIDVSGFVLANGRRVTVLANWAGAPDERDFFAAIHQSACRRFGTVLGPDYNAAHRNHMHLEMSPTAYCH